MSFLLRSSVNNIVTLGQFLQQTRNLLRGILKVVIYCDDEVVAGRSDSAEKGAMLPVVPHQTNAADIFEAFCQALYCVPRTVATSVIYQHDFILVSEWPDGTLNTRNKDWKGSL